MAVSNFQTPLINAPSRTNDTAIWVDPNDPSRSFVIGASTGGAATFNLDGSPLQVLTNENWYGVDVAYGFSLGGQITDLVLASDPTKDTLQIYRINPTNRQLENVTDPNLANLFDPPQAGANALGLGQYFSAKTNQHFVFVSRSNTSDIGQWRLVEREGGKVGVELVRSIPLPGVRTPGTNGETLNPQIKGIVGDSDAGFIYFAQENVGLWKLEAEPNGAQAGLLIDLVQREGGRNLPESVDGLTIYAGANGTGYLLASSSKSDKIAVYNRFGNNNNEFLGNFTIAGVENSEGIVVLNRSLNSDFAQGILVVQDKEGANLEQSNLRFVAWQNVASDFTPPLLIDPVSADPRIVQPLPTVLLTTNPNNISNDLLIGGNLPEVLDGRYGDDTIEGRGGDDIISGNIRRDSLSGGAGNDTIYGGLDNDILLGGEDNDYLSGDLGNDSLLGGTGNDTLIGISLFRPTFNFGFREIDTLAGGAGEDIFILGDSTRAYYDDLNSITPGEGDYAFILDFEINSDRLQLFGGSTYVLGNLPGGFPPGTGLYIDNDRVPGWSSADELIAVFLLRTTEELSGKISFGFA